MGCGSSGQQSHTVRKQKVLAYPSVCSWGLTPVGAAVGTLSQQKPWGWGWWKPTSNTIPLPEKYGVMDA